MLYGYRFDIKTQAQLKNKKNKDSYLLGYKEIEGKVYKVEVDIEYKEMEEMNLFEKYIVKILKEANERNVEIDNKEISDILHLNEDIVYSILENFENIGLVSGLNSDYIFLNYEENKEFLDYDMKFYLRTTKKNYELNDLDLLEENLKNDFDKNNFRLANYKIIDEKITSKTIYYFGYSDNNFLWYSKNKLVNNPQDFELIKSQINDIEFVKLEYKVFCHKEEFLPYLREFIYQTPTIISTKQVDFKLEITNKNYYLLTPDIENAKNMYQKDKVFEYDFGDFVWVNDKVYVFKDDFVVEGEIDKNFVKNTLIKYFIDKIKEIEPNYEELLELRESVEDINYDEEIRKLGTERSEYFKDKNQRKKIFQLEKYNNIEKLKEYSKYWENREKILEINKKIKEFEKMKERLKKIKEETQKLEHPEILKLEQDIKNIKELK